MIPVINVYLHSRCVMRVSKVYCHYFLYQGHQQSADFILVNLASHQG